MSYRQNLPGRLVTQTFADSGQKISEFSQAFVLLKRALDSSNIIQAVFVSTRTLEEVEKLGTGSTSQ